MAVAELVKEPETATGQKPVKIIRLRGVSASIFANHVNTDGREMTFHKISVQRAYKDGDEWKHTTSFGRDDLPILNTVLQRAWDFVLDTEAKRSKDHDAE